MWSWHFQVEKGSLNIYILYTFLIAVAGIIRIRLSIGGDTFLSFFHFDGNHVSI